MLLAYSGISLIRFGVRVIHAVSMLLEEYVFWYLNLCLCYSNLLHKTRSGGNSNTCLLPSLRNILHYQPDAKFSYTQLETKMLKKEFLLLFIAAELFDYSGIALGWSDNRVDTFPCIKPGRGAILTTVCLRHFVISYTLSTRCNV